MCQDLRRLVFEPLPKQRISAPQRQLPGFTGQYKSRPRGLSFDLGVEHALERAGILRFVAEAYSRHLQLISRLANQAQHAQGYCQFHGERID
jgi:hypothetical protein